jgi:hypothetical protein
MRGFEGLYPQYWLGKPSGSTGFKPPSKADFMEHLKVLCMTYSEPALCEGLVMEPLLDRDLLFSQADNFYDVAIDVARRMYAEAADDPDEEDPMSKVPEFWRRLHGNAYLRHNISEFFVLAEIGLTLIPGSVEAERTFSNVSYIKNKQRNRLQEEHLDECVRMFSQQWYTIGDFPYKAAYDTWMKNAAWRLRETK